jgi:O-antigen ligase
MSALLMSGFPPAFAPVTGRVIVRQSNARRIVIFLLLAVALAASDLIRLGSAYSPLTTQTIYIRYSVVFAALTVLCLLRRSARAGRVGLIQLAWIAFGAAVTLSACAAGDMAGIAIGLWMMISVPVFFGRALPAVLGRRGLPLVVAALITSALPYILYSVWFYPIEFPYKGVTANPNSLGVIAAGATTGLIAVVVATLNRRMPWLRLMAILAILTATALVIASGSRTSSIAVASVTLVAVFACYPALMRQRVRLLGVVLACAICATGAFMITDGETPEGIANIISKFENPRASVLNHRDDIWSAVWASMTILGHGRDYFANEIGITAHNSTIQMLGEYGMLAALGVIAIAVLSLLATVRYYRMNRGKEKHALTPALIVVCFWIMTCGEGMMGPLGGAINLSFLIVVGLVSFAPTPSRNLP